MAEELQKHQLLVKLLKMTTSAVDAEALVAMRKANQLLTDAGWDWEKLMAGKITVVGDPFAGLGDPAAKVERQDTYSPPRHAPPPPPQRRAFPIRATITNRFEGHCYCCGRLIAVNGGFLFNPSAFHSRAPDKMTPVCTTCNNSHYPTVGPSPSPRQGKGARKVTADDLA